MSTRTFVLPDLGEGLTEAEIVRWMVAEGDEVRVDQPVVEVETAKAVVELPTPFAGTVTGLHAEPGQTVEVGAPVLSVETRPAAPRARTAARPTTATHRDKEPAGSGNVLVGYGTTGTTTLARRRRPKSRVAAPPPGPGPAAPLVLSPLVRRLARERGVDVRTLRGTGEGGVITRADVERASIPAEAGTARERRTRLNGARKVAAAAFTRSRSEIPEATIWVDIDATRLVDLRERGRDAQHPGPGLLAYLARFVVVALAEYPMFNGRFDAERGEIVESADINLGIAVQGPRGTVVPAIVGAQSMSTTQLDAEIGRLVARARQGKVTAAELAAGTFTLNNYGPLGVDGSAAIINHPQVAILGIGRIVDRPWVVDGSIEARKIAQLSFVFDHRVADGATAAGFVRAVADAIENPVLALARL